MYQGMVVQAPPFEEDALLLILFLYNTHKALLLITGECECDLRQALEILTERLVDGRLRCRW